MFWRKKKAPSYRTPENTRIYAIGDIHGCCELLKKIHQKIIDDAKAHDHKDIVVVYMGDYIDKGPKSKEVIDSLINNPFDGYKKIFLKGNHEWVMMNFLNNPEIGTSWLRYGGDETLKSYGVNIHSANGQKKSNQQLSEDLERVISADHMAFYDKLRLSHVEGDYFFVHAGIRPGVEIEDQNQEDLLGIREEFVKYKKPFDKKVIFGHTIFDKAINQSNKIGVDSGAYLFGRLSCVVLDDYEVNFITVSKDQDV
jgi:serine/threonine protein phosphatase 1